MTRAKYRRLELQIRIPLGRYFIITLLVVVLVNCLTFVHVGFAVANILLALSLWFLLGFSFALCFAGKLDWNELAATL